MFKIESLVSRVLKAGKIESVESHFVADEAGNPVTGKSHKTVEEAQAELGGMKNLQEGLSFAKACFPELGDKALKGKANVVAEYLAFVEGGRVAKVVEEAKEEAEQTEEAPAAVETEEDGDDVEFE